MKLKVCLNIGLILALIAFASAQNRYRNQRTSLNRYRSTNRNRNRKNEPVEQGRTLGLLRPIIGLGLSSLTRPFAGVGYDAPIVPASTQSDPYYGGYGGYGGYPSNYYGAYNYYPYYRPYFPFFSTFFGGYRPLVYPNNYGGYPHYNNYGGQRPVYTNQRPIPIAQPSNFGQPSGVNNFAVPARPSSTTTPIAGTGTASPQINSAQAAQVANLLGQLLGQQLRPLLNQGTAASAPASDEPDGMEEKRYRYRNFN